MGIRLVLMMVAARRDTQSVSDERNSGWSYQYGANIVTSFRWTSVRWVMAFPF